MSGCDIVRALERYGYTVRRRSGSHHVMRKQGGSPLSVPVDSGQTVPLGTLRSISRDAGLTVDEFVRLLK